MTHKGRDEVYTYGVSFGPHVIVKHVDCSYEVWHVPGHQYFGGIGSRNLAPSEYYIVNVGLDEDGDLFADFLYRLEPGKYWKRGMKMLVTKIKELRREP